MGMSSPSRIPVSILTLPAYPSRSGRRNRSSRPPPGRKSRPGSSAYRRASMAWPAGSSSPCRRGSVSPAATASCHATKSTSTSISVTVCSTWSRVFISMK